MINFLTDKKYIINLQKRPDRRQHITEQLTAIGAINFEFFNAIDGDTIDYKGLLQKGEVGVKQSHLQVIKLAQAQKLTHINIIEDDCVFLPGLLQFIKQPLPPNWELFYYGAFNKEKLVPVPGFNYLGRCQYSLSALCYAVNNSIFNYLIEKLQQDIILDIIYADQVQRDKNCYCATPTRVKQLGGYSDIQKMKINYEGLYI